MEITFDIKEDLITHTELIESIQVVYKKNKCNGPLSAVNSEPFEVRILDREDKEENFEHNVDFSLAQQITITFFDGTVKTYQDVQE